MKTRSSIIHCQIHLHLSHTQHEYHVSPLWLFVIKLDRSDEVGCGEF